MMQSKSPAMSNFLVHMSHELRAPLNNILGFSELLNARVSGPLTEQQTRFLRYIYDSGGHLLQLINDLFELSMIEAGRLELRPDLSPCRCPGGYSRTVPDTGRREGSGALAAAETRP